MLNLEKNTCYTYFRITGDFNPKYITDILDLIPEEQWRIGDVRKNGTIYDFANWEFGRCSDYDVIVANQMIKTIAKLIPKTNELKEIKKNLDVYYTLGIVPSIYLNSIMPCLAPSKEIIQFCYETETDIDIDLYVYDSFNEN